MVSNRFAVLLALRFLLLLLNLLALTALYSHAGYHAATLLISLLFVVQIVEMLRFIKKTNAELVRFLDAARHADFSQRFELGDLGSGFAELGQVFSDILKRFQSQRAEQEHQLRHFKTMVEHVPVPLMSLYENGDITIWNNSAKRLFGVYHVSHQDDLAQFGEPFAQHIQRLQPGVAKLVDFSVDGMEYQLAVLATQILHAGRQEMLISMQNIQSELDTAQLQAWQELVRVLTHEIMNSITPIASLAKTAADLSRETAAHHTDNRALVSELTDICDASDAVARRSDGLTQFVGSYRRLTRLPTPQLKNVTISDLFTQISKLLEQEWQAQNISLTINIQPQNLQLKADQSMLEQILINLLQNAAHALAQVSEPQVILTASLNARGHVMIEVADNGPGVPEQIAKKIFVPFYTTKRDGSGVGLALTRQVMMAHGGHVKVAKSALGGALFSLIF